MKKQSSSIFLGMNGTIRRGLDHFLLFDQDSSPVFCGSEEIVPPREEEKKC